MQLKDKFKFTVAGKEDVVYTASKYMDCYHITWEWDGLRNTTIYHENIVESNIYSGRWKMVDESTEEKKSLAKRSISININSAYAAAKWEFENNNCGEKDIQEVLDRINDTIEEIYEKAMNQDEFEYIFSGTGSWTVQFQPEDERYGTIEVLTDVSTGMPIHYINVEEYLDKS